jgi:hypothetical protein
LKKSSISLILRLKLSIFLWFYDFYLTTVPCGVYPTVFRRFIRHSLTCKAKKIKAARPAVIYRNYWSRAQRGTWPSRWFFVFAPCRPTVSNPIMWQFEKVNVPPKLFFLTLFWEFVMFFQLKTSFHYSTDKAKVYAQKNKTSRAFALI